MVSCSFPGFWSSRPGDRARPFLGLYFTHRHGVPAEKSHPPRLPLASASNPFGLFGLTLSWPKNVIRAEISQYLFQVILLVDQMALVLPR